MLGELAGNAAAAIALTAAFVAAGSRVRRWARLPCPAGLRAPVEWLLGSWAFGVVVVAIGVAGAFRPWALGLAIAVLVVSGRWSAVVRAARSVAPFVVAALPLVPVAAAPPFFYDSWVYHLGLPWQALQDGAIRDRPENFFGAFPPLAQLAYAPLVAFELLRATGLAHLLGSCFAAQAAAGLAQRLGASRWPALLAGVVVLYAPKAALYPAFPAAEAWAVCGIVSAVAIGVTARPGRPRAFLAGAVVGIAAASRLQGVAWSLLVIAATLASWRPRTREGLAAGAGVLVGSAPWWMKNAFLLNEPWAPLGWRGEGELALWRDAATHLHAGATLGGIAAGAGGALRTAAPVLVPLVLAAAIVAWRRASRGPAAVLAVAAGGAAAWALTGALPRFLVPVTALAAAGAVAGHSRPARAVGALVVAAAAVVPGAIDTGRLYGTIGWRSMIESPDEVYGRLMVTNPYPAFRACERLPDQARLLLVAEPRGFLLPRPFVTSSQVDPSPLRPMLEQNDDPDGVVVELRRRGFTHVLINAGELGRLSKDYPVAPWRSVDGRDRFLAFAGRLGAPVIQEGAVVVYAVPDAGSDATPAAP